MSLDVIEKARKLGDLISNDKSIREQLVENSQDKTPHLYALYRIKSIESEFNELCTLIRDFVYSKGGTKDELAEYVSLTAGNTPLVLPLGVSGFVSKDLSGAVHLTSDRPVRSSGDYWDLGTGDVRMVADFKIPQTDWEDFLYYYDGATNLTKVEG